MLLGDALWAVAQVAHTGVSLIVSSAIIYRRPAGVSEAEETAVAQGLGAFSR